MRPASRKSMHVASQLTSLVSDISRIEEAVQSSYTAQVQAEERLYQICAEKLVCIFLFLYLYKVTNDIKTVDNALKKVVQSLVEWEGLLRPVSMAFPLFSIFFSLCNLQVTDERVVRVRKEMIENVGSALKECGLDITSNSAPTPSPPPPPPSPPVGREALTTSGSRIAPRMDIFLSLSIFPANL